MIRANIHAWNTSVLLSHPALQVDLGDVSVEGVATSDWNFGALYDNHASYSRILDELMALTDVQPWLAFPLLWSRSFLHNKGIRPSYGFEPCTAFVVRKGLSLRLDRDVNAPSASIRPPF